MENRGKKYLRCCSDLGTYLGGLIIQGNRQIKKTKNPHFLLIGGGQSWQSRHENHQEGGIADTGVARLRFTARSQEALWHIEVLPAFCQTPPPRPFLHTMHTLHSSFDTFLKVLQIGLCVIVLSQQLKKPACCVKNSKPCYKRL